MAADRYPAAGGRGLGRRRLLGSALAGGGAAAFLAACGGDKDSGDSGAAREVTIAASTRQAETSQPKPGGIFNVRQSANAPLDPHLNSTFTAQTIASYVYTRLLKYKTGIDPAEASKYEVEGDSAESFETPDGITYTFKLRANGKWQDIAPLSGRPLDSEDVKFSLERFRTDPKSTNRAVFGTAENPLVQSVETPDPRTVVFKLAKPYAPFKTLIANSNYLWIMPKEIGQGRFDPGKQMIGAGPFILESTQPDVAYKVKRNPAYYDSPRPYIDGVNLAIITEIAQEFAQFQAGRLDAAGVEPARVEEMKKSVPKATSLEFLPTTYGFLAFQLRGNTPFRDERVRRAASMSIDRDGILAIAYENKGVWQTAIPALFSTFAINPKTPEIGPGGQYFKHDPAEAKKLLAAAGYGQGLPLRFIYTNNIYGERFNQVAEAVNGMLREGGFNTQVIIQDYLREYITPGTGTFFGNFEGVFYGLSTSFGDPHDYLYNMNHSRSTRNHAGVNDPQLDAMIDKAEAALQDQERVKQIKDIQRYLAERMYYAPASVGPDYLFIQEWVKNYQRNNAYGTGAENRAKLWIDRG